MSLARRVMDSILERQLQHNRSTDRSLSFHASSMGGHRCDLRVWYERMRRTEAATYSAETACRMEDGTASEEITRRWLKDAGIEVEPIRRGKTNTSLWEKYELTGAIDGWLPELGAILEHKCVSQYVFERWTTQADVIEDLPWGERYACQIAIYMLLNGVDLAILLLRHRGHLKDIPMCLDDAMLELAEDALKRIERVQAAIKSGQEPAPRAYDSRVCGWCPYLNICPVERPSLTGTVIDDPELAELMDRRETVKDLHSEFEKADRIVKSKLKALHGNSPFDLAICGNYEVVRSVRQQKARIVEAGEQSVFAIKPFGAEEAEDE